MVINLLAVHATCEIFLLIITKFTTVVTEESKSAASKFGTHGARVEKRVMTKRLEKLRIKRASVCVPVCAQTRHVCITVQTQMAHGHSSKPLGVAATPHVTLRHFAAGAQPGGTWGQEMSRGFRPVPEHQAQC